MSKQTPNERAKDRVTAALANLDKAKARVADARDNVKVVRQKEKDKAVAARDKLRAAKVRAKAKAKKK